MHEWRAWFETFTLSSTSLRLQRRKKFFFLLHANCEEIATSSQSSLQVQLASVKRMIPKLNSSDFVNLSFFLVFSHKLRGRVTRNIERKAHGLSAWAALQIQALRASWDPSSTATSASWVHGPLKTRLSPGFLSTVRYNARSNNTVADSAATRSTYH